MNQMQGIHPFLIIIAFFAGGALSLAILFLWRHRHIRRIRALTDYLENVSIGNSGTLLQFREDEFSKLQDEIYKTVT
ncbi:MAG: hypothetical protein K2O57_01685 [Acetatifactor sp.]|nr:hypothetical protein [Acetatifactor sp.]